MNNVLGPIIRLLIWMLFSSFCWLLLGLINIDIGFLAPMFAVVSFFISEIIGANIVLFMLGASRVEAKSSLGQLWYSSLAKNDLPRLQLYYCKQLPFDLFVFDRLIYGDIYLIGNYRNASINHDLLRHYLDFGICSRRKQSKHKLRNSFSAWSLYCPLLSIALILPRQFRKIYINFFVVSINYFERRLELDRVIKPDLTSNSYLYKAPQIDSYHRSVFIDFLLARTSCFRDRDDLLPLYLCKGQEVRDNRAFL